MHGYSYLTEERRGEALTSITTMMRLIFSRTHSIMKSIYMTTHIYELNSCIVTVLVCHEKD
jgi:hypothetical protein